MFSFSNLGTVIIIVQTTVNSQLFEPPLIRNFRLFEVTLLSPWICLPNSGKNSLSYSNFSYSKFQLFEVIFCPRGPNFSQLFEVTARNGDFSHCKHKFFWHLSGRGAYEVLDYRITVDFFENYRNTVIKFLYKYRHRSISY